jgi:hypothetical protein
MISGLFCLAIGLYLFIITNYIDKVGIIIVAILGRFLNGVVIQNLIYFRGNLYSTLLFLP